MNILIPNLKYDLEKVLRQVRSDICFCPSQSDRPNKTLVETILLLKIFKHYFCSRLQFSSGFSHTVPSNSRTDLSSGCGHEIFDQIALHCLKNENVCSYCTDRKVKQN